MSSEKVPSQTEESLSIIAAELNSLRRGAEHLREVFGEAAVTSDLTFIKILEEKYGDLTE